MFFSLDIETANVDYSSICQIGIAKFENGKVVDTWVELINPEDYFDPINISIHSISKDMVKNSKTFPEVYNLIKYKLENSIVVHHMPFDKIAINRACEKYNIPIFETNWLDTAKVSRRSWEEFAYKGYGLKNIAKHLDIQFKHHDALEDAIACGKILCKAIEKTNSSLEEWFNRVEKSIKYPSLRDSSALTLEGNPDGHLFGETIVFTGALQMVRSEAAKLAASVGCKVENGVNKNTSILVVGMQDVRVVGEKGKSSKHIKAENLIKKGDNILIISEDDFMKLIEKPKALNI